MTPGVRLLVRILLLVLCATPSQWAATPANPDPDKDPNLSNLLHEARALVDAKKPEAAIEQCDHIIARFKTHYASSKSKIYCAQSSAENLGYLLMAAAAMDKGEFDADKKNAIVLSPTWSTAYFIKAYALQDLRRLADAKSVLQLALELSPWNSRYLSELGSIYVLEKNWAKAKEVFAKAEDQAPIASEESKKKYQQCLAADPKDTKAAQERDYVRSLRAKTKAH